MLATKYRFMQPLPDLMNSENYAANSQDWRLRLRVYTTAEGVEWPSNARHSERLEQLLDALEAAIIEQMLGG